MNKTIRRWHVTNAVLTIILGTALHFVYKWSNDNKIVGVFGAVNESVWEHLKLLFWPFVLLSIPEYIFFKKKLLNYFYAKAISLVFGLFFIISMYYTYKGVFGEELVAIDISLFIISAILSHLYSYKILTGEKKSSAVKSLISMLVMIILIAIFVIFTFSPPKIPLFLDPNTGRYGII